MFAVVKVITAVFVAEISSGLWRATPVWLVFGANVRGRIAYR